MQATSRTGEDDGPVVQHQGEIYGDRVRINDSYDGNGAVSSPIIKLHGQSDYDPQNPTVHQGVFCAGPPCNTLGKREAPCINGIRYKCVICQDFDLYAQCASLPDHFFEHTSLHPFLECQGQSVFIETQDLDERGNTILGTGQRGRKEPNPAKSEEQAAIRKERISKVESRLIEKQVSRGASCHISYGLIIGDSVPTEYLPAGPPLIYLQRKEVVVHHKDMVRDVLAGKVTPYRYSSKDQVYDDAQEGLLATRLIDLFPGTGDDKLECVVRPVRLVDIGVGDVSQVPPYEALSWTWKETSHQRASTPRRGKDTGHDFLNVVNISHPVYIGNSFLCISAGLRDALLRLRRSTKNRTLWIDQFSIDQSNTSERSFQVSWMRAFYLLATRVVVWAGDEDQYLLPAFELIEKLAPLCFVPEHHLPSPEMLTSSPDIDLPVIGSEPWIALLEFFNRPVFSRTWVIQEICVGRRVVVCCGDMELDWKSVAAVAALLSSPAFLLAPWEAGHVNKSAYIRTIKRTREAYLTGKESSLISLIVAAGLFEITDRRDRVFALLGLTSFYLDKPTSKMIRPDYEIPVEEVYSVDARMTIEHEKSLDIWGYVVQVQVDWPLPSWAPDWNSPSKIFAIISPYPWYSYSASGNTPVNVVWPDEDDPAVCATRTYYADTVTHTGEVIGRDTISGPLLLQWTKTASFVGPTYITGESAGLAFQRTCVIDSGISTKTSPDHDFCLNDFTLFAVSHIRGEIEKDMEACEPLLDGNRVFVELASEAPEGPSPNFDAVMGLFLLAARHRRIIVTQKGYLGLGPMTTRPGDEVHIISGGRIPFVLRRSPDKRPTYSKRPEDATMADPVTYRLQGDAFVYGLMNGEALSREVFGWKECYIR